MSTLAGHPVTPLDAIPLGEGRAFAVDGHQVAVFRLRGGGVHVTQARCPHAGGPLADGQLDDCVVVCPLHGNAFELSTGASPSGVDRLEVYPVRVEDGIVTVTLPG
jgi:nitrite reductase (NADH) small subunit